MIKGESGEWRFPVESVWLAPLREEPLHRAVLTDRGIPGVVPDTGEQGELGLTACVVDGFYHVFALNAKHGGIVFAVECPNGDFNSTTVPGAKSRISFMDLLG